MFLGYKKYMCYVVNLILQIFWGFVGGYFIARGLKLVSANSKFLRKGLLYFICGVVTIVITILFYGGTK